jgi:hypothetical protein
MSKATSYADHVTEWETLLGNVAGEEILSGLSNQAKLQSVLDRIKTLLVQQKERQAAKQEASQQVRALIFEGKDLSRDLKAEIVGKLGARSEQLVRFKVKPLRLSDRPKKSKAITQAKALEPASAGTASGAISNDTTA